MYEDSHAHLSVKSKGKVAGTIDVVFNNKLSKNTELQSSFFRHYVDYIYRLYKVIIYEF